MKNLNIFTLLLVGVFTFTACGDDDNDFNLGGGQVVPPPNTSDKTSSNSNSGGADPKVLQRLEFPKTSEVNGSFVIVHRTQLYADGPKNDINYCVEWDPTIHAQRWCCYQMTKNTNKKAVERRSNRGYKGSLDAANLYPNDQDIDSKYHFTIDPFSNSGYDHGHICPSNDRVGTLTANDQTFYMTNMMPQVNAFNAGIWAKMELQVNSWANNAGIDTLYVVKGGTISGDGNIIKYLGSGQNKIPVPKYFFMAALAKRKNESVHSGIGFWVEHDGTISSSSDLSKFAKNIDEIEQLTGLDLFCNLPDSEEEYVEAMPIENLNAVWSLR